MWVKDVATQNEKKIIQALTTGEKDWQYLKSKTKLSERTLSKHLKRLIERGVIEERIDPKDRRKKIYRLASIDPLRDDLITLNLMLWMESTLANLYNKHFSKERITQEDISEYIKEFRLQIADFLLLCHPDDMLYYSSAVYTLSEWRKSLFDEVKQLSLGEEGIQFWEELKNMPTEELFKRASAYLKTRILTWLCYARTSEDEIKKVLQKYVSSESFEEVYKVALKRKREAEEALEKVKNLWIYQAIKINESEIPSYEDIVRKIYGKE